MKTTNKKRMSTETLVLGAILTALVVVLQMMGSFIRLGPFQIALVLIPIVIGAATCGVKMGAWLGFVFGVVVLLNGDAAPFLTVNAPATVLVVLVKGTACGLVAGIIYKLIAPFNRYVAVVVAAIVCPVVNTGVFLVGCVLFFFETISAWGLENGFDTTIQYMFLGLAGGNFLFELLFNIVLSPVIVRVLNIRNKHN